MIGHARVAGLALAALAAIAILATPAAAQSDYPNRPIQLIVPYGPGGVADVGMRIMAEKLSVRLKQNVVIENRPGAAGIVAAKAVATAAPDGYNVLMTGNNNAIAVALFKSLPYDILKDFASTSTVSFFDLLIVAKAESPQQEPSGYRQGGEGQSRQAQHRHHQSRQHAESRRRAVQERHRHQIARSCRSAPRPTWRPRCCAAISMSCSSSTPQRTDCSPTRRSSRSPRPGPSAAPICPRCRPRSRPASRTSRC